MHHLALQVGEVDAVAVGDGDAPEAARREVKEGRGAQAARADHQRMGSEETLLRLLAELVEQQVAAVAEALWVVHARVGRGARGRAPSTW